MNYTLTEIFERIVIGLLVLGLLSLLAIIVFALYTFAFNPQCGLTADKFRCADYNVEQCLASEKYTKEQCVELVSNDE